MSEADIRADRLKKIERLKEAGMDPYPAKAEPTTTISHFIETFAERESGGESATIAGRVMASRGQGGIMFADIFDGTGRIQTVLQKDDMDGALFELYEQTVDTGDFVEITGTAYTTKRGAQSIKAQSWRMIAKSLLPIPNVALL
jgi:lysyl-tRNA synthetase class 2